MLRPQDKHPALYRRCQAPGRGDHQVPGL